MSFDAAVSLEFGRQLTQPVGRVQRQPLQGHPQGRQPEERRHLVVGDVPDEADVRRRAALQLRAALAVAHEKSDESGANFGATLVALREPHPPGRV